MGYFVSRNGQQSGPYEEAVVRQYLAEGSLFAADFAREATASSWTTLGALFPEFAGVAPPVSSTVAPYATTVPSGPMPPSLHWAIVLLIGFFTGIFAIIWLFIQAAFVKRIMPQKSSIGLLVGSMLLGFGYVIVLLIGVGIAAAGQNSANPQGATAMGGGIMLLGFLLAIAGLVLYVVAVFRMRSALVEYYNTVEPIELRLNGVMTFFFAVYYFQHHLTRIAKYKETGYLSPQG